MQLVPFPLKPDLQVQVYDPTVLVQTALLSQLFNDESAHSSTSEKMNLEKLF